MAGGQTLLHELGRRLRDARAARGWGVSELARESGLSRRYVTEAEAGRANLSVLKLAGLAGALRVPLPDLFERGPAPRERIALVGLRGAGKSTVGRALALELEAPFVELDARVERLAGMSLEELFDLQGVDTYRRLEREALEQVLAEGQRQVIATGGSIVNRADTFGRLREACRTVWLSAQPEQHLQRVLDAGDRRPSAGRPRALDELRAILDERGQRYARCGVHVDTAERTPAEVRDAVLRALEP